MTRSGLTMLVALVVAPAVAYLVYLGARGLGFLDPPMDRQHELRREIVVSIYAFLIFLPALIYGWEKGWPRAWIVFGIFNALVLLFFGAFGVRAAVHLWRLRHPEPVEPETSGDAES